MKRVLVVGSSKEALLDYERALSLVGPHRIIAVNAAGIVLPHVDYWVSLHADRLADWAKARKAQGLPPAGALWTAEHLYRLNPKRYYQEGIAHCPYRFDGTSGALGVFLAEQLGATHIVLAGIPLINGPHFYEGSDFSYAEPTRNEWLKHKDSLTRVKSMSGWTAGLLGKPTLQWLTTLP